MGCPFVLDSPRCAPRTSPRGRCIRRYLRLREQMAASGTRCDCGRDVSCLFFFFGLLLCDHVQRTDVSVFPISSRTYIVFLVMSCTCVVSPLSPLVFCRGIVAFLLLYASSECIFFALGAGAWLPPSSFGLLLLLSVRTLLPKVRGGRRKKRTSLTCPSEEETRVCRIGV